MTDTGPDVGDPAGQGIKICGLMGLLGEAGKGTDVCEFSSQVPDSWNIPIAQIFWWLYNRTHKLSGLRAKLTRAA